MAFTNIRKPQGSLLRIRMFAHKFHIWNKFKHMWNYRHIFKSFQNQIFSWRPWTACRTASWCQLIFWFILILLAGALHSWKWLELNAWKTGGECQLDLIGTLSCSFRSQSSSRLRGFGVSILYTGSRGSLSSRTTPHSHKRLGWGNVWKPRLPRNIKKLPQQNWFLAWAAKASRWNTVMPTACTISAGRSICQTLNTLPIYHL